MAAKIGHLQSEYAVTFGRNDRPRTIGIRGQMGPEYAEKWPAAEIGGRLDFRYRDTEAMSRARYMDLLMSIIGVLLGPTEPKP
jgi:hypothetical protein